MNPTRDEILRLLIVMGIRSIDESSDIDIQNILKYNTPFELTDDLQIPYVGYVKSLISDGTGSIKQFPFTRSDITNIADGIGDLILPFTGGQIALGLISRAEQDINGIPTGDLVANLAGGPVTSYNQIPDVDQYGIVYYVGEVAEEPPFVASLTIANNSTISVDYAIGASPGTLPPGDAIFTATTPGLSVQVDVLTGQTCVYTVYDSVGDVVITNTVIGPGTENGIPMTADQRQQFIILDIT